MFLYAKLASKFEENVFTIRMKQNDYNILCSFLFVRKFV